jgi:hypothetical protein
VETLHANGSKRETIRKSTTALAQVLDFAGVTPNPARDRVQVRMPREDAADMEPPTADHVEAVCWLLTPDYMLATLARDNPERVGSGVDLYDCAEWFCAGRPAVEGYAAGDRQSDRPRSRRVDFDDEGLPDQ